MGCISLYFTTYIILCKITIFAAAYGILPFWNYRNQPFFQHSVLRSHMYGENQFLANAYNINVGGSGGIAPVYDPKLLLRHTQRSFNSYHQNNMELHQNIKSKDCDSDSEQPNTAQILYEKIYGRQYKASNRNPSLINDLRFIGNEKYFISLIRQKLQKLIKEERKTAIRDQIALGKIKFSVNRPLWNGILNLEEVHSRNEPEEFRYTTLSTFIGDFFCSWCDHTKGRSKRACLKYCFQGILEKYDNLSSSNSENSDLDFT